MSAPERVFTRSRPGPPQQGHALMDIATPQGKVKKEYSKKMADLSLARIDA